MKNVIFGHFGFFQSSIWTLEKFVYFDFALKIFLFFHYCLFQKSQKDIVNREFIRIGFAIFKVFDSC